MSRIVSETSAYSSRTRDGLFEGRIDGAVSAHRPEHPREATCDRDRGDVLAAPLRDALTPHPNGVIRVIAAAA